MTQTSPQPTERVTSRQRRIDEQRKKIDSARRQQRNRQLLIGAAILGVVIVVVVLATLFIVPRGASGDQMRQVPQEAANHVQDGSPLTYRNRPPSSGVHFGTLPQASDYRLYDQPLGPGRWLHM